MFHSPCAAVIASIRQCPETHEPAEALRPAGTAFRSLVGWADDVCPEAVYVRSQGSARHTDKPHAEPWPLVAEGYRLPLRTILLAPLQNQDAGEVPHAGAYRCLS